jgi:hypothetical protein
MMQQQAMMMMQRQQQQRMERATARQARCVHRYRVTEADGECAQRARADTHRRGGRPVPVRDHDSSA